MMEREGLGTKESVKQPEITGQRAGLSGPTEKGVKPSVRGRKTTSIPAFPFILILLLFFTWGCAQRSAGPSPVNQTLSLADPQTAEVASPPKVLLARVESQKSATDALEQKWEDDFGDIDFSEEKESFLTEKISIADPLEPFNRAMFHFNDRLYFWLLKPVAQGYRWLVPQQVRVGVANFFNHIAFPIRFVNNLLQGNFRGAGAEVGRFTINSLWGVGGFLDPAGSKDINLKPYKEDFGQTLGYYGLGPGFYINWPVFGPSSPRDTLGMLGDFFLNPLNYLDPAAYAAGAGALDRVNHVSLNIGDYEALKQAAIDPYIAVRDAYMQYRTQRIRRWGDTEIKPKDFRESGTK